MQDESASFAVSRNVMAGYEVNMEADFEEFNSHFSHCNIDFKERIIKNVQTMKLKSTNELNQAVSLIILHSISIFFICLGGGSKGPRSYRARTAQ